MNIREATTMTEINEVGNRDSSGFEETEEIGMFMDVNCGDSDGFMENWSLPNNTGCVSYNNIVGTQPDCVAVQPGASQGWCIDNKLNNLYPLEHDHIFRGKEVITSNANPAIDTDEELKQDKVSRF